MDLNHNGDLPSLSNLVGISLPCCVLQLWQIAALMVMPYFRSRNAWSILIQSYSRILPEILWSCQDGGELAKSWIGYRLTCSYSQSGQQLKQAFIHTFYGGMPVKINSICCFNANIIDLHFLKIIWQNKNQPKDKHYIYPNNWNPRLYNIRFWTEVSE